MVLRNAFENLSTEAKQDAILSALNPFGDLDAGRRFAAGGKVSTAVLTPNADLTLTNPAGSGKNAYVASWSVYADAIATVRYHIDAMNAGALVVPENLNFGMNGGAGAVNSAMEVRLGTAGITGGRQLAIAHQVNTQAPVERNVAVKVTPGRSLTIRFLGPGTNNEVEINIAWIERLI